ncbi:protein snail [Ceratitis capitata]|uniref:protein snail n=1 Tax=Ceratitis capitata TaxID=7213 RepID=UPI000329D1AE|nr:protein snail [Ceratitis capitata]
MTPAIQATYDATRNYKCPLKKRPVVYVVDDKDAEPTQRKDDVLPYYGAFANAACIKEEEPDSESELSINHCDEEPQDLSLKRKFTSSTAYDEYEPPIKREHVLDLSKTAYNPNVQDAVKRLSYQPISPAHSMNSPAYGRDYHDQYDVQQQYEKSASKCYNSASKDYKSAFMLAAACAAPMAALWNPYQSSMGDLSSVYPSPASSLATPLYTQHMTPPSSPSSEDDSDVEDLSIRSDIPLPALLHHATDYNSAGRSNSSSSSASSTSSNNTKSMTMKSSTCKASTIDKTANFDFKCDKCSKMYSTGIGLAKHQQYHCPAAACNREKKLNSCPECGKVYNTAGAMKMHVRTHTLPCKCPICGKAFSRPWLLQGHIRTHTGEKPFQCTDCPRSFADRSNLRAHQQTHAEVKKYACKRCNKSFSRMSLLNKHASTNCSNTNA